MNIKNGNVNYGDGTYEEGDKFYLPHSCDEWVIGDLTDAKKFAEDLSKTIKEVEDGLLA